MGGGGAPSGGRIPVRDRIKMPTPNRPGKPNARYDYQSGRVRISRFTGKKGEPTKDYDYNHGGNGKHDFPHTHYWDGDRRGDSVPGLQ